MADGAICISRYAYTKDCTIVHKTDLMLHEETFIRLLFGEAPAFRADAPPKYYRPRTLNWIRNEFSDIMLVTVEFGGRLGFGIGPVPLFSNTW